MKKSRIIRITLISILVLTALGYGIFLISKNVKSKNNLKEDRLLSENDKKVKITIGETEEKGLWSQTYIYPDNIDDTFVIDVCLPDNYDENKKYPAVYLTDCYWRRGDYPAIKNLYETGITKEFILFGIGYPDDYNFDLIRQRDLIENPRAFLKLIIEAVIPYVESQYSVDTDERSFLGASYGGYFMLYSLFQSDGLTKDMFKNYIINSPAFNYPQIKLPIQSVEENYSERSDELGVYLYITVGGAENEPNFKQPLKELVETIKSRNYKGLTVEYEVYDGLGHYDVWVPTLLEGLSRCLKK